MATISTARPDATDVTKMQDGARTQWIIDGELRDVRVTRLGGQHLRVGDVIVSGADIWGGAVEGTVTAISRSGKTYAVRTNLHPEAPVAHDADLRIVEPIN